MEELSKINQIVMCDLARLVPYANNARKHSARQLNQLVSSLREFGFVNPILVDANNMIIAGHGRAAAAKKLGLTEVPTLRIGHLTEAQKKAYIIVEKILSGKKASNLTKQKLVRNICIPRYWDSQTQLFAP